MYHKSMSSKRARFLENRRVRRLALTTPQPPPPNAVPTEAQNWVIRMLQGQIHQQQMFIQHLMQSSQVHNPSQGFGQVGVHVGSVDRNVGMAPSFGQCGIEGQPKRQPASSQRMGVFNPPRQSKTLWTRGQKFSKNSCCRRCGEFRHSGYRCDGTPLVSYTCGQAGHIARSCPRTARARATEGKLSEVAPGSSRKGKGNVSCSSPPKDL